MTLYVDSSALVKRYVKEPESQLAIRQMDSHDHRLTGRHTVIEVRRALALSLSARPLKSARSRLADDLLGFSIVELDEVTCERAAQIAESIGVRTLDALHLAAAERAGGNSIEFLSFDIRQAAGAHQLGFTVVGIDAA